MLATLLTSQDRHLYARAEAAILGDLRLFQCIDVCRSQGAPVPWHIVQQLREMKECAN